MKSIVSILLTFFLLSATAQQPDLVFHHLTQKDGLSYNIVNCFFKDSRGMLWIGTYNGLNRYDGAHFYIFRKGKDKNSLPDNTVHKLAEDKKGNIWGATDNGIFCYSPQQNTFKNYHTPGEKEWRGLTAILSDKQGTIWAANENCLVKFNSTTDSFEKAPIKTADKRLQQNISIRKNGLLESPDGKGFWIASRQGLFYYDKVQQKIASNNNTNDSLLYTANSSSALCATNFGHYWYYDNGSKRLVGFDPLYKKIKYTIQPKEFENRTSIATVFEDNNHLLWVCTWQYDVYTIDYLHGNKVTRIQHDKNNLSSIAGDFFWDAIQESDGTLWLGTVGGISRCNTRHSFYKVHSFTDSLFAAPNAAIEFVSENKNDSTWWITTNKEKLLHYNPATSKVNSIDFNKMPVNKTGLQPNHVNRLLFYKNSTLLFSDYGAWIKDGATSFKPFILPAQSDSIVLKDAALMNDSIMYCSDYKKMWRWNTSSNKVEELQFDKKFTIENGAEPYIVFLTRGANGKLWTLNGKGWLSYVEGNNLIPRKFLQNEAEMGAGFYTSMAPDKNNNLWLTRKGEGLLQYNSIKNTYRMYKQYDGLVMEHVMAVSADSSGKIWTASYNQFSVLNPLLNSFYNFTLPLSVNNYAYTNFMTSLANGNVIGNVANEIVEFFPGRLKTYSVTTQPLISTLSVGGTEKLLPENNSISLAANENSFLIKFGLLADGDASPYDMLYILEGAEKTWTTAGTNFEATYNSLSPGNYTFKVKALAKDKSWQTKETTLKIYIATPFYKSWWFIGMLVALFTGAIYSFYRYRLRQQQQVMQLESKAQLLEKEKTTVMYESLKQQLNPHFLFNSLTSLSGLIETDQKLAGNFLEQMSKLYRYILKNSDKETVLLKDEIVFVKLYTSLQKTRFTKGLEINIDVPEEYLQYKIAPVTLQNMVENAIKHNIIDASSPLVIDIFVEADYVVVKNNLQRKGIVETSNMQGLANLKSLYRYLSEQPILIEEDEKGFTIRIPLI